MASSFLSTASKKVTDVRGFLRDAAGSNSIKYVAEKGSKHLLYIPYKTSTEIDESGAERTVKELEAISGAVHEWQSPDGKYKATVCMKDVVRYVDDEDKEKGMLNDGSCPFCNRVTDAWDIYRYRKDLEDANCKLNGEERKKHMERAVGTFADERKAKDARTYMYILVVKFRQTSDDNLVMGQDGLPEYDLKVMKLSQSRVDKIQQQIANAGAELPGSELMFEYPNTDDRRLQISQSTTAPVFPNNMQTVKFPKLLNKINEDVRKFEWEGIEKSFPEWNGMSSMEAQKITDALFEQWDKYKKDLSINPGAKYMEYITAVPVTNPSLGGGAAVPSAAIPSAVPSIPGVAPAVPNAAPAAPVMPSMPTAAPQAPVAPAPAMPTAPTGAEAPAIPSVPDPNTVFGGAAGGIQL